MNSLSSQGALASFLGFSRYIKLLKNVTDIYIKAILDKFLRFLIFITYNLFIFLIPSNPTDVELRLAKEI